MAIQAWLAYVIKLLIFKDKKIRENFMLVFGLLQDRSKKIGVIAMAAILVIKDDHELQGLIDKI